MEVPLWGIVTGAVFLLGGFATLVGLLGKLMRKAAHEAIQQSDIDKLKDDLKNYVRTEVFEAVRKDMEGIGRKVGHLESDQRSLNDKYLKLEGEIVTELKNTSKNIEELKGLFLRHLEGHNV